MQLSDELLRRRVFVFHMSVTESGPEPSNTTIEAFFHVGATGFPLMDHAVLSLWTATEISDSGFDGFSYAAWCAGW
jgi:hypothetical protein